MHIVISIISSMEGRVDKFRKFDSKKDDILYNITGKKLINLSGHFSFLQTRASGEKVERGERRLEAAEREPGRFVRPH